MASPSLTSALLQDLLDPTTTPIQICQLHNLTLDQLEAIITSPTFQRAAAQLDTITNARAAAIESNTHLQTQSLQRAIAHDAYLAAADLDQAAASRDPNRAAIKARYLETARKANAPLGARTRGQAAQCGHPLASPALAGEVSREMCRRSASGGTEGGLPNTGGALSRYGVFTCGAAGCAKQ
ncbi:MAG: hypothetical protein KDA29_15060, partial [Phycisphaerales bacterium]|nr:hypothetical protein [Phycisphaerales bacterium]